MKEFYDFSFVFLVCVWHSIEQTASSLFFARKSVGKNAKENPTQASSHEHASDKRSHKLQVVWASPCLAAHHSQVMLAYSLVLHSSPRIFKEKRDCSQSKHYRYKYGGWLSEKGCLFRLCVCFIYLALNYFLE